MGKQQKTQKNWDQNAGILTLKEELESHFQLSGEGVQN